jgi:hypothetical protein
MAAEGIQLEENLEFQRREWAAQRIGAWTVLAFVVAAALGFFGAGGAFSRARADAPDAGVWVEYDRFARVGAPARLQIHSSAHMNRTPRHEVQLNRTFFDSIRIEQIVPEPQEMVIEPRLVKFRFAAEALRPGGEVVLDYQPLDVGGQHVEVQVDDAAPVSFKQFAYF